jgi:FkbM family methyltransferase
MIDLHWLNQVLAEQSDPSEWHYYQVAETRVLAGDVVADCGAAEGLFALQAAQRAKRVFAIEPLPLWIDCMRATFRGVENVEILPYALSDRPGTQRIRASGLLTQLDPEGDIEVQVETVDNLFEGRGTEVSYIKADLEGHDLKMLEGAKETILHHAPRIAITTYHEVRHADHMRTFLRRLNPRYRFRVKGIDAQAGAPVMLHAWT